MSKNAAYIGLWCAVVPIPYICGTWSSRVSSNIMKSKWSSSKDRSARSWHLGNYTFFFKPQGIQHNIESKYMYATIKLAGYNNQNRPGGYISSLVSAEGVSFQLCTLRSTETRAATSKIIPIQLLADSADETLRFFSPYEFVKVTLNNCKSYT